MAIKTNAIDLYDRATLEQHAGRKLIVLTGMIEREIVKVGYEQFINTDLDYLAFTHNYEQSLYKNVSRDAVASIQQDLRDKQELLKNTNTGAKVIEELRKLYDKNEMHELLYLIVIDKLKDVVIKELETTLNSNIDFYKERHDLYLKIDALIVEIEQLISKYDAKLQTNKRLEEFRKRRAKAPNTKLPDIQIINLDLSKFFNNDYILNQVKKIDENAHKKDLTIEATLLYDSNDFDIEDVRFSNMITKEGQTESVQLYPIHYALLSGFTDIRDANGNIDKSVKLQDVLRYITDDIQFKLPTNKKSLQTYEDMMLFAKKVRALFTIIDNETGEELFRLLDPIPLLENYKAFSESTGEYEYIVGNSFITAFKTKMQEIYGTQRTDKKENLTSKTTKKALLNDGQRNDPAIINTKWYIYPKIMQMINAVSTNKPTNNLINIELIYKYYATYRGHTTPTKDDKQDARATINKYLDYLKSKGLVKSYEPIKNKKTGEILQYKVYVNSNKDLKDNTKKALDN